jgi:hypothetical protein
MKKEGCTASAKIQETQRHFLRDAETFLPQFNWDSSPDFEKFSRAGGGI